MNYYEYLGISMNASFDEINEAYKKLAKKFHPDKNLGDKYFEEQFKQLNEAHSVLSDVDKRQKYDVNLINETNKYYEIEDLKKKIKQKELGLLKQEELLKIRKEAQEKHILLQQQQLQERQYQQSIQTSTYSTTVQEQPKDRLRDKLRFWKQAVNVMWVLVVILGIIILTTNKGEWKKKTENTEKSSQKTTTVVNKVKESKKQKNDKNPNNEKQITNQELGDTVKSVKKDEAELNLEKIDTIILKK